MPSSHQANFAPVDLPDLRQGLQRLGFGSRTFQQCGTVLSNEVCIVSTPTGLISTEGVARCRSFWQCPTCRLVHILTKKPRIKFLFDYLQPSHNAYFCTFTLPHTRFDSISSLMGHGESRTGLLGSWRKMLTDRSFRLFQSQVGLKSGGLLRALEFTYGENGFHPHFHTLFFTEKKIQDSGEKLFDLWQDSCEKVIGRTPSISAFDFQSVTTEKDLVGYFLKQASSMSLSSEMASDRKIGKGLSLLDMENAVVNSYNPQIFGKLSELKNIMYKKRHMNFNYGIRELKKVYTELYEDMTFSDNIICQLSKDTYDLRISKDFYRYQEIYKNSGKDGLIDALSCVL